MSEEKGLQKTGSSEVVSFGGKEAPNSELSVARQRADIESEIKAAIVLARRFPRDEARTYGNLMKSCQRISFAGQAFYSFPRGRATVEGPSVNMAREAARTWGNIRFGLDIVRDDEESRKIQAWCWDLETNLKVTAEDEFKKLIYRKSGGWIKPDERDLRELTNRRGAISIRNCILQVIPKDFIEDAMAKVKKTLRAGVSVNLDETIKKMVLTFGDLGVSAAKLEKKLGHKIMETTPDEVVDLRAIRNSIHDGNSKIKDHFFNEVAKKEKTKLKVGDMTAKKEDKKEEEKPFNDIPEDKKEDKGRFDLLKQCQDLKKKIGEKLYYEVLGSIGFNKSNEMETNEELNQFINALKEVELEQGK